MFNMCSSEGPLCQFQPNFVGNILGGWGFTFVELKGAGSVWGPIRKILINLQKVFFS